MSTHIFSGAGDPPQKRATTKLNRRHRRMAKTIGFIGPLVPKPGYLTNRKAYESLSLRIAKLGNRNR